MLDPTLKFKNECGCSTGKYATIVGIFGFIAFVVYFKTYVHFQIFTNILKFFYFLFCFSIIGKAVGLAKSYLSYKKTLKKRKHHSMAGH